MVVRRITFVLIAALALAAIPAAMAQITSLREVQQILKDKGYYTGQVDNLDGPLTKRALTAFQTDQGLPVTGRPDQATLNRLNPSGISAVDIAAANPGAQVLEAQAEATERLARVAQAELAAAEREAESAELTAPQQAEPAKPEPAADTVAGAIREAGDEARSAVTAVSTPTEGAAERTATAAAPAVEPKAQPAPSSDSVRGTIKESGRTVTDHGKSALSESKGALAEAWAEIKRAFGK